MGQCRAGAGEEWGGLPERARVAPPASDSEGRLQRTLGQNLRRVRVRWGLSQERFGEAVGWDRTLVGAVERGERNLTLKTVERLSARIGLRPIELLHDAEVEADGGTEVSDP